jgi:hypothetical protein
MKTLSKLGIIGGAALFLTATPFSLDFSHRNVTPSLDTADAATVRAAGVHRRAYRRAGIHGVAFYRHRAGLRSYAAYRPYRVGLRRVGLRSYAAYRPYRVGLRSYAAYRPYRVGWRSYALYRPYRVGWRRAALWGAGAYGAYAAFGYPTYSSYAYSSPAYSSYASSYPAYSSYASPTCSCGQSYAGYSPSYASYASASYWPGRYWGLGRRLWW